MLFPTERTKQGQLRLPGSEISALAPYRVCVHQIPNISTKLSPTGGSQVLSKRRKIDESNPISWLATSAASPCSQGMRAAVPVPPLPAPSGHKMQPDFTSEPRNFFFFSVTLLCPAHCPRGKVPAQLPVLLTQSLLCLLPHKYLQFKATLGSQHKQKGMFLREFSAFTIWIRGSAPQAEPNTHWAEGQGGEARERSHK